MEIKHVLRRRQRFSDLGYRLIILVGLVLWIIGFVNLAGHTNPGEAVFGIYSTLVFAVLVVYSFGFLIWVTLLATPKASSWLKQGVAYIQARTWLALLVLALLGVALWVVLDLRQLLRFPMLRLSFFVLVILAGGIVLFAGWDGWRKVHVWRRLVVVMIAVFVVAELFLQFLGMLGALPGKQAMTGLYVPYGRVYYNLEGFGNSVSNNYGWYYPDFRLDKESKRIVLIGDSFVQGLQVKPSQNVGVVLEQLINERHDNRSTEVLALGMPGFGPGLYLSLTRLEHAIQEFDPDEIIILFNLGSDFQTTTEPSGYDLYFELKDGNAVIHDDSVRFQHDLKHLIFDGYDPVSDPVSTLQTHLLTPKILQQATQNLFLETRGDQSGAAEPATPDDSDIPGFKGVVLETEVVDAAHQAITAYDLLEIPGKSNFVFEKSQGQKAESALMVAMSLLKLSRDFARAKGVAYRIVTIPAFPKAFYSQVERSDWATEIADFDLFLPERALQQFAEDKNIPFLAMGQYMFEDKLAVDEIQSLYFSDGLGHFTTAGHEYFARAIYNCFYGDEERADIEPAKILDERSGAGCSAN
jgi:hypothetical protein